MHPVPSALSFILVFLVFSFVFACILGAWLGRNDTLPRAERHHLTDDEADRLDQWYRSQQ